MSSVVIDGASLLAQLEGTLPLAEAEAALAREGLTLGVEPLPAGATVGAWLAEGAPGAPSPWLDPVDHLIAGLEATMKDGSRLVLKPAPRRAVGPDLIALLFGTRGRFGSFDKVWLRVHRKTSPRAEPHAFEAPELAPTEAEQRLWDAIAREITK